MGRVDVFLQKVALLAAFVANVPDAGYSLRDPDDLPYLNLAVASDAHYLVSWDKDLRDLMKEETFVGKFPKLQIVDPVAFLNVMRASKGQ